MKQEKTNLKWDKIVRERPNIALFGDYTLFQLQEAVKINDFSNELLDDLSTSAKVYSDELFGGLTPREYELFLPVPIKIIEEHKKLKKRLDDQYKGRVADEREHYNEVESDERERMHRKSQVLWAAIRDIQNSELVCVENDECNDPLGIIEKRLPDRIPYQTLRTNNLVVKTGTYKHPNWVYDERNPIVPFLLEHVIEQNGIILDMRLGIPSGKSHHKPIETIYSSNKGTRQTNSLVAQETNKVLNKFKKHYDKLSEESEKKHKFVKYFTENIVPIELSAQTDKALILARSGLEVKISSSDEKYVDELFNEVKKISHESYKKEPN